MTDTPHPFTANPLPLTNPFGRAANGSPKQAYLLALPVLPTCVTEIRPGSANVPALLRAGMDMSALHTTVHTLYTLCPFLIGPLFLANRLFVPHPQQFVRQAGMRWKGRLNPAVRRGPSTVPPMLNELTNKPLVVTGTLINLLKNLASCAMSERYPLPPLPVTRKAGQLLVAPVILATVQLVPLSVYLTTIPLPLSLINTQHPPLSTALLKPQTAVSLALTIDTVQAPP